MVVCLLLLSLLDLSQATVPSIAIVGGGIGGASTSYFLNQLYGGKVKITVFERDDVLGGRLREMNIGGKSYDSGGSIIHSSNLYAKTLTEKVNLKEAPDAPETTVGLYNTTGFLLQLSGGNSDMGKLFWRYGMGLGALKAKTEAIVDKFSRIYCLQSHKAAFKSVPELLNRTDPDLLKAAQTTMRSALMKEKISDKIQYELVTAALRSNYNQELKVNAFVGYVGLAGGMGGKLWKIDGGNYQLPRRVLETSKATVVKGQVNKVVRSGEQYTVTYTGTEGAVEEGAARESTVEEVFDSVVLATPLHDADIEFDMDVTEHMSPYQTTYATFVNGVLAPLEKGKKNPSDILTVSDPNDRLLFSSIGLKGKADKDYNYKVFTKKPLTDDQLAKLFSKIHEVKVVDWKAYPHYTEHAPLPSFELAPGLYNVNAIEMAASAIEMSCIGGRNAALLVYHHLNKSTVDTTKLCKQKNININKYKQEL